MSIVKSFMEQLKLQYSEDLKKLGMRAELWTSVIIKLFSSGVHHHIVLY